MIASLPLSDCLWVIWCFRTASAMGDRLQSISVVRYSKRSIALTDQMLLYVRQGLSKISLVAETSD